MKTITFKLLIIIALFTPLMSVAQGPVYFQTAKTFEFGPRFGFTTSIVNTENSVLGDPQVRFAWVGGVFGRYQINERLSVQLGVDYAQRGGGFKDATDLDLTFLDVPVTAAYNVRFNMFDMPMTFDVFAGVQPSFLLEAKSGSTDVKEFMTSTGYDVVVGSGFPMWRFMFFATTKIGLADLNDNLGAGTGALKSISTEWTVAYRIGGTNAAVTE